jgi:hypothetical protein
MSRNTISVLIYHRHKLLDDFHADISLLKNSSDLDQIYAAETLHCAYFS